MATENYISDSRIDCALGGHFAMAAHANSDPTPHGSRLRPGRADRVCNNPTHRE